MAVKTFFFKDVAVNGFGSLSETDPGVSTTFTGWTVGKIAALNFNILLYGTKKTSGTFSTTNALTTAAAPASGNAWRSENTIDGVFANTDWTITFRMRANAASAQTGRLSVRLWRGTNPAGTGATQITSSVLVGTTTATLSVSADVTSTVTFTPGGTITLNGEYLFVQCEWEIVGVSGSNTADAVFRASVSTVVTPDFGVAVDAFTGGDLPVSSPVIGVGNLSQIVALLDVDFEVASPTIGVGTFVQSHILLDVDFEVASPVLGVPTFVETIPSGPVQLSDFAIDNGLDAFVDADQILLCSAQPTSYANAISLKLGGKIFGPGATFSAPQNASPTGRKVVSNTITDGTVTASGTAAYWVAIDSVNSQWLANGIFTGSGAVVSGQGFSLDAFAIHTTG